MGRKAGFERDQVLDDAMRVFWRQGYRNTSIRDLTEATGLGESSLYHAFGDKRSLYEASLAQFFDMVGQVWARETSGASSPLDAIRRFWYWMCDDASDGGRGNGCMIANTAVEMGSHDPEMRKVVLGYYEAIVGLFEATLRRAQAEGELSAKRDVRALARFLTHSLQGMRVMAKVNPGRAFMRDIADQTLSVLED